ncbi:hypothetical protein Taro_046768 [Colocasia esculenta]|uniref:Uncharacterized protein n=1 Tax=Colocasia esculenta TaxID=4460 RepID=A0A843WTC0_COLES|nr:hypothetical protein [Colocasia esculenta]
MAPHRRSQARQLIGQHDESEMPAQGQVQEEVSADESVAQPQGAAAAAAVVVPEQQVEPEVEQPERQQRSGTGSTRARRQRTAVTEDRTTLLEMFLCLRPLMFHGEYDPDKAESWTHELERIFETMECVEEDQYHQRFVRLLRHVPHVTVPAASGFARSLGSCLLAGAVRAGSRSASLGLQSNQLSREPSRAVRRQFAAPVAYRATSGGIAPWGKPRSSSSQCSTLSSRLSTSTLPSSRHRASSSGGSTSSRLSSFCSRSSTIRTNSSSSTLSSRHSSSSPSRAARVLVDPSASLCFASEEFCESLACHAPERQCDVMVDLPSGDYMRSFGYLEGVAVEVEGHQLPARLYALQLCDFYVILGMDWLEAYSAVVDCQRKTVRFRIPGDPVLCFRGETSQQRQGARRVEETGR